MMNFFAYVFLLVALCHIVGGAFTPPIRVGVSSSNSRIKEEPRTEMQKMQQPFYFEGLAVDFLRAHNYNLDNIELVKAAKFLNADLRKYNPKSKTIKKMEKAISKFCKGREGRFGVAIEKSATVKGLYYAYNAYHYESGICDNFTLDAKVTSSFCKRNDEIFSSNPTSDDFKNYEKNRNLLCENFPIPKKIKEWKEKDDSEVTWIGATIVGLLSTFIVALNYLPF
jgi:hypothetical protein